MTWRDLKVTGGHIAYHDAGSGPAMICIPSMGDLRAECRILAPQFASPGCRALAMHVRGHGDARAVFTMLTRDGVFASTRPKREAIS